MVDKKPANNTIEMS
jgi:hypothetical protein